MSRMSFVYRKSYDTEVRGVLTRGGNRLYEVLADEKVGYIDALEYTVSPALALVKLAKSGLFFSGPKRKHLFDSIAEIEQFHEAPIFDRVGHNGACFVSPSGEVFSPPDVPSGEAVFETRPEKCHRAGTVEGWLAGVAAPLSGHQICEFFMMAPFAGPLRGYTQIVQNFGWEIVGGKGTSKTVLLQLMASACGGSLGGDEGNFGLSFATTDAGLESEMPFYSDSILIIDEGGLYALGLSKAARGRAYSQLLMQLGKGQEKQRYKTTPQQYRYIYVTNANESLLEVIGGTSTASVEDAVADRLMTIPLPERDSGVFERLPPGYEDIGDFIADLIRASSENHGVAMPHFLQGMVNLAADDREHFVARIESHMATFRAETHIDGNPGSARRVADGFGLVYAAAKLAIHLGALPDSFDPLGSTLACYRLYRAAIRPQISPTETLLELLEDSDVIDLDLGLPSLSKKQLSSTKAFRKTKRSGKVELYIPPDSIHRLIPSWNVVRRDDFEVARMLVREDKRHTVKRKVRSNVKGGDRVICIVPDRRPSPPSPKPREPASPEASAKVRTPGRRRRSRQAR